MVNPEGRGQSEIRWGQSVSSGSEELFFEV